MILGDQFLESEIDEINEAIENDDKQTLQSLIDCAMEGIYSDLDFIAEHNGQSYYLDSNF